MTAAEEQSNDTVPPEFSEIERDFPGIFAKIVAIGHKNRFDVVEKLLEVDTGTMADKIATMILCAREAAAQYVYYSVFDKEGYVAQLRSIANGLEKMARDDGIALPKPLLKAKVGEAASDIEKSYAMARASTFALDSIRLLEEEKARRMSSEIPALQMGAEATFKQLSRPVPALVWIEILGAGSVADEAEPFLVLARYHAGIPAPASASRDALRDIRATTETLIRFGFIKLPEEGWTADSVLGAETMFYMAAVGRSYNGWMADPKQDHSKDFSPALQPTDVVLGEILSLRLIKSPFGAKNGAVTLTRRGKECAIRCATIMRDRGMEANAR